jgi:hypothetical protein
LPKREFVDQRLHLCCKRTDVFGIVQPYFEQCVDPKARTQRVMAWQAFAPLHELSSSLARACLINPERKQLQCEQTEQR